MCVCGVCVCVCVCLLESILFSRLDKRGTKRKPPFCRFPYLGVSDFPSILSVPDFQADYMEHTENNIEYDVQGLT